MATISHVSSGKGILSPQGILRSFLGVLGSPHHPLATPTEKCADCFVHGKDTLQITHTFLLGVCQHAWAQPASAATAGPGYPAAMTACRDSAVVLTGAAFASRGHLAMSSRCEWPQPARRYGHPAGSSQGCCSPPPLHRTRRYAAQNASSTRAENPRHQMG